MAIKLESKNKLVTFLPEVKNWILPVASLGLSVIIGRQLMFTAQNLDNLRSQDVGNTPSSLDTEQLALSMRVVHQGMNGNGELPQEMVDHHAQILKAHGIDCETIIKLPGKMLDKLIKKILFSKKI